MAYWRFSDKTVLYNGARVEGNRPFADHLRTELYGLAHGEGPLVWLDQDKAVALQPENKLGARRLGPQRGPPGPTRR